MRVTVGAALLGCWAATLDAQSALDQKWAELRRRIDQGIEVKSLVGPLPVPLVGSHRSLNRSSQSAPLDRKRAFIRVEACQTGVPPALALAVFEHESGVRNDVRGAKGEIGAAQILPRTAAHWGFNQLRLSADFEYNVRAGLLILRDLLERFNSDEDAAIRAYNGGPGWQSSSIAVQEQVALYVQAVSRVRSTYAGVACP